MNKSSSFLVHLHLLHFVIIKKISIFKRKILHFSKEKSPKPYSKGKISNEQIFNKNFQNFNGKISKNKSSRKNLHEQIFIKIFRKFNLQNKSLRKILYEQIFRRKNLQNHITKEKSPRTNLLKNFQKFNRKISRINL